MNRYEEELKVALQRREAPPDFAERVLARIAELPQPESRWQRLVAWFRVPQVRFAMATAMVCLLVAALVGVPRYQDYQRRKAEAAAQEGEIARAQVLFAFQIASSKLNKAKQKVSELSERGAKETESVGDALHAEEKKNGVEK